MAAERLIHNSENGDRWMLIQEFGSSHAIVRHAANPASGGQITDTPTDKFLSRGHSGPEHAALRRILAEMEEPAKQS